MKLIKDAVVTAGICDSSVKLSVTGAFGLIQDLLTEMMAELSLDGVSLRERYGCVWVFTRNRIEFDRALNWNERYIAESYISSAKGAKATVDTVLKDSDGRICVYSRIEMCVYEPAGQRIRRIRDIGLTPDTGIEAPEREIEFSRMKHEGLVEIDSVTVRSEDIDFIRHTNNVSYIRYIMNTYSVSELHERPVRAIEVRYAGQTHEGDKLTILKAVQNGRELFDIEHDGSTAAECEIER